MQPCFREGRQDEDQRRRYRVISGKSPHLLSGRGDKRRLANDRERGARDFTGGRAR